MNADLDRKDVSGDFANHATYLRECAEAMRENIGRHLIVQAEGPEADETLPLHGDTIGDMVSRQVHWLEQIAAMVERGEEMTASRRRLTPWPDSIWAISVRVKTKA